MLTFAAEAPEAVGHVIESIEHDHPAYVVRAPGGLICALTIPNKYTSDATLSEVRKLSSLSELVIFSQAHATDLTAAGMEELRSLTNLDTLTVQCQTTLPPGILKAICTLGSLRSLTLNRALPPTAEYSCLTNLTNLKTLSLFGVTNFGDAELKQLSTLPLLKELTVSDAGVTESKWSILRRFRSLTNAVFWEQGESWSWSRPPGNLTRQAP